LPQIFIGFDQREAAAFFVCRSSIERRLTQPIRIRGLILDDLRARGLYTRPTERRDGELWDVMSGAPMSTEFACSRFFIPHLQDSGWALFMDCDMLARVSFARLFEQAKEQYAVMVVKHQYEPSEIKKMDGQTQTRYARKNWSSFVLWNLDHPAHKRLTLEILNTWPGRDLHAFKWLEDDQIGELPQEWNHLVNVSKGQQEPNCVHWTLGGPWFPGHEHEPYADEWRHELHACAA
jgi:hypothetical protein